MAEFRSFSRHGLSQQGWMARLALSCSLLGLLALGASAWAQTAASLQGIRFQKDRLVLQSREALPKPHWETWQSVASGQPSRMLVVDLPGVTGDLNALKAQLAEIERKEPRFARLLLLSMINGNLRLVMELSASNGTPPVPVVDQVRPGEIFVSFEPPAVEVAPPNLDAPPVAVSAVPALVGDPVADKGASESLVALKRQHQELQDAHAKLQQRYQDSKTHLQASLEENIRLQRKQEAKYGGKTANQENPAKMLELAGQLQSAMGARDDLQQQVQDLQRIMAEQDRTISDLRHQISLQTDIVRGSDPSLANVDITDARVNANLRSALLRVAVRLKELEEEVVRLKGEQPASAKVKPAAPAAVKEDAPKGILVSDGKVLVVDPVKGLELKTDPAVAAQRLESELRARIRQNEAATEPYLQLSGFYQERQNYAAAESVLQQLLASNPQYAGGYYELARLYLLQQRPQPAQALLETYRRLSPQESQRIVALERMIQSQLSKERRQ